MPTVTILLPTYQPQPAHLRAAIDSVLAQTFIDWELVIHDDASTVDVEGLTRPYMTDPCIRFHRNPVRRGIGGNWNASMHHAKSAFIAFLFQDDMWHPDYLKRSIDIMHYESDVGFTAADHVYVMEGSTAAAATGIYTEVENLRKTVMKDGRIPREEFLTSWIERGLRPNLIGEPSFVILRQSLMDAVGPFREDMRQGLDADYWVRCLLKNDGWWISEKSGEFRVHPKAATTMNEQSGAGCMDRLRIFRSLIRILPSGPMKTLAKRIMRRELIGMAGKFVKKRLHWRT